ncbi:MAG: tRNA1(Val) (adenine(37)-N6)-methyltransferase, partial [Lachnospiraceae bacterium]|nr:tRNA1(Val) (adenine(37)-N6)-methyltransferase [Lachnospiraceae bacterium]
VKEGERLDDLERNNLKIIQNPKKFCFGIDAVLLTSYIKVKKGEKLCDLCCGNGIIPLLMSAKSEGEHFTGVEIQEECADLAKRSVEGNELNNKIDIVCGDIKNVTALFKAGSFSAVSVNPPYMIGGHGLVNPADAKAIARHEVLCSLDDVVAAAAYLLPPGGRLYMVHRPFRLSEIFERMSAYKLEPKKMQLVYPFVDKEPNMVLIEAVKGGKPRLTVEKPLIVYKEPGVYTTEVEDLYHF